jgi:gliding motility-associated-like protein
MKRLANFAIFSLFYLSSKLHCQVVINEVMHYPVTAQGLTGNGTEYVELFNNSNCDSVDISCWKLGFADVDGFTNNRGSIVLPIGTLIPPLGHFVIGTSNSSANPNAIDFKTNLNTSNLCVIGSFLLANGDGWIALYNNNGDVVDALFWTVNPNEFSKISSDSDLDDQPCIVNTVSNCNTILALLSANQIYQNFPSKISYGGQGINGNTFSRIPDGGSWQRDIPPSINDLTVGNCNGGNCTTISAFNLNASITQPTCNNSNGSISFSPSPSDTYFYLWPFATTGEVSSVSNLAAGSYNIIITNINGCSKDTTIVLTPSDGMNAYAVETNPSCGQSDGSISIVITGGTLPYSVSFNNSPFSTNTNFTNLSVGNYQIIIKDANGCEFSLPAITLVSPNTPTDVSVTSSNPSCGQNDGSISLGAVSGGSFPYLFSINGSTFSTASDFSNLTSGNYQIVVQDVNGCTYNAPLINLTSPNGISDFQTTLVSPSCGASNGSITVLGVAGGQNPYSYSLNNLSYQTDNFFNGLTDANYLISVIDANGCQFEKNVILNANSGNPIVFIPNVFSPDDDPNSVNELWSIKATCIEGLNCQILNRWGNLVHEIKEPNGSWNGNDQLGNKVSSGMYFYKLIVTLADDKHEDYHGFITLIR